jgi:hypothetical protein
VLVLLLVQQLESQEQQQCLPEQGAALRASPRLALRVLRHRWPASLLQQE